MQEMLIYGVSFDLVGKQPIVLLKTADGNKFLPIWIGHPEAAAILMKLQSQTSGRPMTHDLVSDMLEQLGASISRITVTELRENTFYAQITVIQDGQEIEVDSRPSDAIARRGADLRGGRRHRGVGDRVRGRGGRRGAARGGGAQVPQLPRGRHAGPVRRRERRRGRVASPRRSAPAPPR
jgi:bifunctional DNase/RNase